MSRIFGDTVISGITLISALLIAFFMLPIIISCVRAKAKSPLIARETFFLPHDFFITLVLLMNFWVILLVLLGSQGLAAQEASIITIILSFFAPLLSFWQRKRWEKGP